MSTIYWHKFAPLEPPEETMDNQMTILLGKARMALNNILAVVGSGHVLAAHVMEAHQAVNDMEKVHTDLWLLLEGQTKPQEDKKEFQEVE